MKRLAVLILLIIPFIQGCKDKDDHNDNHDDQINHVREIAWNDLSEREQSTVIIDWKQAPVEETTHEGKDVYSVRFNTEDDALLGPIVVYIDRASNEVVGYMLRL